MAVNDTTLVNGVTKFEVDSGFFYYFPLATIEVNNVDEVITSELKQKPYTTESVKFEDITEQYGAANSEEYVDYLANNRFFFEPSIVDYSETGISLSSGAQLDAANRLRVSQVTSLGDYRQTNDNLPLFFDEVDSGSTETSTYDQSKGGVEMEVFLNGEYVIRQTKQWHNYSSGKSQLGEYTFSNFGVQTDVIKRFGYFHSSTVAPYTANIDGIYLYNDGVSIYAKVTKDGTDTHSAIQSSWDDPLDGSGDSGYTVDWDKFNVFVVDFLYLGGTAIRFGLFLGGNVVWFHKFVHANNKDSTMVIHPNQPVRYEIRSTGGAGTFTHICSQVASEGAVSEVGIIRSSNQGSGHTDANSTSSVYALVGIRLKLGYRNIAINPVRFSVIGTTSNDYFLIELRINPTVAGTFTYSDEANSAVQSAKGSGTGNTVTGGTTIWSDYAASTADIASEIDNALRIGTQINGSQDTLVLCVQPLTSNIDVSGALTWRELV